MLDWCDRTYALVLALACIIATKLAYDIQRKTAIKNTIEEEPLLGSRLWCALLKRTDRMQPYLPPL